MPTVVIFMVDAPCGSSGCYDSPLWHFDAFTGEWSTRLGFRAGLVARTKRSGLRGIAATWPAGPRISLRCIQATGPDW